MRVVPLIPDSPLERAPSAAAVSDFVQNDFAKILNQTGNALERADAAEEAFAAGGGSLQDAVFERAQADIVLSVATAVAQRSTQALQSILNLAV